MDGSYEKLTLKIAEAFGEKVRALRRRRIKSFFRSKVADFASVYMIFDQVGVLVYVGRAKRTRSRLKAHLSTNQPSSLLSYVCGELGINPLWQKGHMCECRRFHPCGLGGKSIPPDVEADDVASKIEKTYTVSFFIDASSSVERLVADVLRPRYGFHRES